MTEGSKDEKMSLDDVLSHHGLRRNDKIEHADKQFNESQVKRDGRGQFATKASTMSDDEAKKGIADLVTGRTKNPPLLASLVDAFRNFNDQRMREKHVQNARGANGITGPLRISERQYIKTGQVPPPS